MFSEDLMKYISSLKNCHTTCGKRDKNYKKNTKNLVQFLILSVIVDFWIEIGVRIPNFYKIR